MSHLIAIGSETLPIVIRKHPRSRRMTIRYQPRAHCVSLTLPRYVSLRQGLRFVEEKRGWLARQLQERPRRVEFTEGAIIPVLGELYRLKHVGGRGVVTIIPSPIGGGLGWGHLSRDLPTDAPLPASPLMGEGIIEVPGDARFMERRVREFLKTQARDAITPLALSMAETLGKNIAKISFRDTVSHWGSCTKGGRLSFSWRLALAPCYVLEYLAAHEVAHLKHLNHSPAFWQTVAGLYPAHETARAWLRAHGNELHLYG